MSGRLSAPQRREQLLDICARVVDVEGFPAATIDRVAGEAGVSRTVVYQQFGGLDGMYDALVARGTQRAADTLTEAGTWDAGTPAKVMATVLAAADTDRATWRLFLVVAPAGPHSLVEALAAGRRALRRQIMSEFADGADPDAKDDAGDSELAARLLQAVADEVIRLRLADPTQYDHERLLAQYNAVAAPCSAPEPAAADRRRITGIPGRWCDGTFVGGRCAIRGMTAFLATGIKMSEFPRWHDGRFWMCDWLAGEMLVFDADGGRSGVARVDGSLLDRLVAERRARGDDTDRGGDRWDLTPYGATGQPCNEIVVDRSGRAWVNMRVGLRARSRDPASSSRRSKPTAAASPACSEATTAALCASSRINSAAAAERLVCWCSPSAPTSPTPADSDQPQFEGRIRLRDQALNENLGIDIGLPVAGGGGPCHIVRLQSIK